jgi:hypothetical protein
MITPPPSHPMDTAQAEPGEMGAPVLLFLAPPHEVWVIGRWDSDGWFDDQGFPIAPTRWAPLPAQ